MLRSTALGTLMLCLGTMSFSQAATPDHLSALPADTWLVLQLESVHELREKWSEHPLNELWLHPKLQAFIAPGLEDEESSLDEELLETFGVDSEALLEYVDGSITFALSEIFDFDAEIDDIELQRGALIWEVVEETEAFALMRERNLESLDDNEDGMEIDEIEREFEGVTLWIHEIYDPESELSWEDSAWAEFDGLAIISMSSAYLEEIVASLHSEEADGPAFDEKRFEAALEAVNGGGDGFLYLDIQPWVRSLSDRVLDPEHFEAEQIETAQQILDVLQLDNLQSLAMSFELNAEDSRFDFAATHRGSGGVLDLMAFASGQLAMPDFLPVDAASVSTTRFAPERIWQEIALIVEATQPGSLAMASGMIKGAGQGLGIELDLQRDLLGSLGMDLVTVARPSPAADAEDEVDWNVQQQLFGLAIEDRQAIERVLSTFEALGSQGQDLIERRDYLGQTISWIPGPDPAAGPAMAWTITDEWLLVCASGTDLLEASLRGLADRGGNSIWDRKDLKAALAKLPENPRVFGYQSGESMIGTMLDAFIAIDAISTQEGEARIIDSESKPDPEVLGEILGPLVSAIYQDEHSTVMEWHAFHALDER